jgi:hypothetical protein
LTFERISLITTVSEQVQTIPLHIIATGGRHMPELTVDSFQQALEVRKKFPQVFYSLNYQKIIIDAAKTNPAFFDVEQKEAP